MCGIAGYVGPAAELQVRTVEVMSASLSHRGPDDSGKWSDSQAALAHRRLSIIDTTPAGHQPMLSGCGRYVLTYNGEIYNYLELRRQLVQDGRTFSSHSDSEVLLNAFAQWGERCVERFNGMWAFAVWDRIARRLFLSRDRFGEKPLYYITIDQGFWFASEIKALVAARVVRPAVNPLACADFGAERVTDHTEDTFFQGVKQLPPAHSAWIDAGTMTKRRYWSLPLDDRGWVGPELIRDIGALLEDAVRLRLRSDVEVGVLLSGGLDSSSVACLAAQIKGTRVSAFSTIDKIPPEEAIGIEQVLLANPQLELHRDTPGDDCLDVEIARCLWHQEEPFADGSMIAHFRLMRLASQSGVRVLLTGQAADEVFAGYPGFLPLHAGGLLQMGAWRRAWQFARAVRRSGQPGLDAKAFAHALPRPLAGAIRRMGALRRVDWLAPDYRHASTDVSDGYAHSGDGALNSALRACISTRTLPGFLHYEDRNSMAFGVETRIPFLDHRLVERVLPLSAQLKLEGGRTKALLRDTMTSRVPSQITLRLRKQGYPAPLSRWLRSSPARSWRDRLGAVEACPIIAFDPWLSRHQRFMAGNEEELPAVWRGLSIALWYQQFVHGAS
jgi:asparagine synthase (glutamine-hydrolysing)